jgi:hypothetical protein
MKLSPILLGLSVAATATSIAAAQDVTATPPKVIQLTREWIKPGKNGMVHDRSESAFVSLMNKAKLQGHYVALNSMSGKSRALYLTRYPSFAAWEADNKIVEKNAALQADFDRAAVNDGELLDGIDQAVFTYDEELSYHPHPDLSHARYYEISVFHVRPGHSKEWHEVSKMYRDACDKADIGAHWAMYSLAFGGEEGTYLALTHRDSLAEIDKTMADDKKFLEAVGGLEGMQKLDELFGQAVDTSHAELFSINPKQSYADEQWIKGDPEFWKPKASEAAKSVKPGADTAAKAAAPSASKPASH